MTSTAITTESAAALGTVDGREFAKRNIAAMVAAGSAAPQDAAVRKAVEDEWIAKQIADHDARRLDLACRGADLAALEAYSAGRERGFCGEMESFAATLNGITDEMERETAAAAAKLNRAERRKAAALAKKAKAP